MQDQIEITAIAAGGAGVGRLGDGLAVFVHRTAPGELVRARVEERKARWARARLLEVLRPAPERREAPCPHYARCGGCTLEHMTYDAQLRAKALIVADALRRIGGRDVDLPDVVPSPSEFRYRNRVSFTLVRLPRGAVLAGFHELGHPGRIVDITEACMLPESALAHAWGALRRAWGPQASRLPAGTRLRLTLRATGAGDVVLLVDGGHGAGEPDELLQRVPRLVAIWQRRSPAAPAALLAGAGAVPESWEEESVELGGTAFLPVHRAAAALLEAHVLAIAGPVEGAAVVDAYCGVGLHTRRLARAGARVIGIELEAGALAEAERAAPAGTRFLHGRVEERLAEALPADLVILNPPRAGADSAVTAALLEHRPRRVVYVSCDPATLARDLGRLGTAYAIRSLRCFDLFPQTAHVETVAELTCATS